MNAQAITMDSMNLFKKVLSISSIIYRFTMVFFMFTCMLFFYKSYKYNVGTFHLQKELNSHFVIEANYNGAVSDIEFSDENILNKSKTSTIVAEESSFGLFVFDFLKQAFNVHNNTYIYDSKTNNLVDIIPAKNNIIQNCIVQLRDLYISKPIEVSSLIITTLNTEAKKEQDLRVYRWFMKQKLEKERLEALQMNQVIEEEEDNKVTINSKDTRKDFIDNGVIPIGL